MTSKNEATDKKAYPLRIDPTIFKKVQDEAKKEGRSVNKQIEFLLRKGMNLS